MKTVLSVVSSAVIGALFGALSQYSALLQSSWVNLLFWALIGLLLGLFIEDSRYVKWSGPSYGLFLTLSFLISGFQGNADKIPAFAVLSLVLCIVGALCGWCLVFLGNRIKGRSV
jgi:uncharacterized membrane protein YeaQ/YmgE (transglycosylase-associated protein family)